MSQLQWKQFKSCHSSGGIFVFLCILFMVFWLAYFYSHWKFPRTCFIRCCWWKNWQALSPLNVANSIFSIRIYVSFVSDWKNILKNFHQNSLSTGLSSTDAACALLGNFRESRTVDWETSTCSILVSFLNFNFLHANGNSCLLPGFHISTQTTISPSALSSVAPLQFLFFTMLW